MALYLYDVYKHLKISQQLSHITVKYHQLSSLYRKRPVSVWSCNHGSLTSSEKSITGHLYIKVNAEEKENVGSLFQGAHRYRNELMF